MRALFLFVLAAVFSASAYAVNEPSSKTGIDDFVSATCGGFQEKAEQNQAACLKSASDYIKRNPLETTGDENDIKLYQAKLVESVCGNAKFANHVQGQSRFDCIEAGFKALAIKAKNSCGYKTVFGMTACLFDALADFKSELAAAKKSVVDRKKNINSRDASSIPN